MKTSFTLDLPNLLYFVKASCHENLHDTISDLRDLTNEVQKTQKDNPDFPTQLPDYLKEFLRSLQRHLADEENNLFPSIESGSHRDRDSIPHLTNDHDALKHGLFEMRRMTGNYQVCAQGCGCELFYEKLSDLDRILLNHIQIEDNVLFPMLEAL